jgi:hypothetical protein
MARGQPFSQAARTYLSTLRELAWMNPHKIVEQPIELESHETLIATFRPDRFNFWSNNLAAILVGSFSPFTLLHTQDRRLVACVALCICVALSITAVKRARKVFGMVWSLTNRRIADGEGRSIHLSKIRSARSAASVKVVSENGHVIRLVYLAHPADAASRIRAAASALRATK